MNPTRLFTFFLVSITVAYACVSALAGLPATPHMLGDSPPLRSTLPHVPTVSQRLTVIGYERKEFGDGWAPALIDGRSCNTRHATLLLQLADASLDKSCRLVAGQASDPYSSAQLDSVVPIEIDHIFPLSAAWDMGAHAWPAERRVQFANDPLNLIATSKAANQEKSDKLPSEWMPSKKSARCWYARRLAAVAARYELPLPQTDQSRMQRACWVREFSFRGLS